MFDYKRTIFSLKELLPIDIYSMKNNISSNIMNHSDLKNLSKQELIDIIQKLTTSDGTKPGPRRPIPTPRRSVAQMVQEYEQKVAPVPAPRTKRPVAAPRTRVPVQVQTSYKKPVPAPRTKIEQTDKALKGFTKSYEINIKNKKDPLVQLQNTRKAVANHIENMLISMKGLKFVETIKVTFTKMSNGEIVYKTAYFNSPAQTIINNTEIDKALEVSKQGILNKIAVWISEGSGWTVESVENHYLNVVKYEPMKGSSYIKLPTELRNSAKGLINMKNEDNECFRWCHIRHLNPQDKDPQRIKKNRQSICQQFKLPRN